MNALLTVKDTLPRKEFTAITQLGLKAMNLAQVHVAEIGPRLPQGMLKSLSDDLEALGVVIPGALQTRSEARAATSAQNAVLAEGYARVKAVRAAVRKAGAPVDVKDGYGVGQQTSAKVVRDVKAALSQIIDRAKAYPDEAAGLGIVAKDLAALTQALAAITDADTAQEQKRASAPLSTQERNRTANRILLAVRRIEGAGRMEFASDEATRVSFEALGAGPKRVKKAVEVSPAPAGTPAPAPAP